jgi:transposase
MSAKPQPSTNDQIDWEALFRDESLSYSQIAKKTGRKRSTVIRKASELHLRYVRSGRQGPNQKADPELGRMVTQMKREGYSNQEIAAKTGMSLTSITHAHDRYGARKIKRSY